MCVLWENTSSNLYKQIRNEGMLTIPLFRYIKKLISAISVETGLTDQRNKYLEARIAKLNDREMIGSLILLSGANSPDQLAEYIWYGE